jgi:hypothetical protein
MYKRQKIASMIAIVQEVKAFIAKKRLARSIFEPVGFSYIFKKNSTKNGIHRILYECKGLILAPKWNGEKAKTTPAKNAA